MNHRRWPGLHARRLSVWVGLVLLLVWMVRTWLWVPTQIEGDSMLPLLRHGQNATINQAAYLFRAPQRGDLVVLWTGEFLMVKRIIGLPGERIELLDGLVMIDGRPLPEPYVQYRGHANVASGIISPHCLVVVGDNRSDTILAVAGRNRIVGRLMGI